MNAKFSDSLVAVLSNDFQVQPQTPYEAKVKCQAADIANLIEVGVRVHCRQGHSVYGLPIAKKFLFMCGCNGEEDQEFSNAIEAAQYFLDNYERHFQKIW